MRKNEISEEQKKRESVLMRKNKQENNLSDIISFVSNSNNIWQFLGDDRLFSMNDEVTQLIYQKGDRIAIEKCILKKD